MTISDLPLGLHDVVALLAHLGEGQGNLCLLKDFSLEGFVIAVVADLLEQVVHLELEEVVPFVDLDKLHDVGEDLGGAEGSVEWLLSELDHLGYKLNSVESLKAKWYEFNVTY